MTATFNNNVYDEDENPLPSHITLTQAEYDALTTEEQNDANKMYFIPNGSDSHLIDLFYPVGSYYETSDTNFDPNNSWGGTWILEEAGQVHVSAGTGYTVNGANASSGAGNSDGGETTKSYTPAGSVSVSVANHTLVANEIPQHNHGSNTLTGGLNVLAWKGAGSSGIVSKGTHTLNKTASNGSSLGGVTYTITATHTHDNYGGGGAHGHAGSTGSFSGTATNINVMQPYIIVNRWHRTA